MTADKQGVSAGVMRGSAGYRGGQAGGAFSASKEGCLEVLEISITIPILAIAPILQKSLVNIVKSNQNLSTFLVVINRS